MKVIGNGYLQVLWDHMKSTMLKQRRECGLGVANMLYQIVRALGRQKEAVTEVIQSRYLHSEAQISRPSGSHTPPRIACGWQRGPLITKFQKCISFVT